MRQLNVPCLLCRHIGLSTYPRLGTSLLARTSLRASSLSAIHRGLRNSEKARPQGFKPAALETAPTIRFKRAGSVTDPPLQFKDRPWTGKKSTKDKWEKPTYKLKKGKKDITEGRPKGKSRRARFNDPDSSFGKKSLVFQAKHGMLGVEGENVGFGYPGPIPEKHKPISKDDFERALRRLDKPKPQPQLKERFDNSFRSQSETRSHHRPGNHIEHRVETRPDKRHDGRFSRDMPKATRERPYKPNFLQSRSAGRSEDGLPPRKIALDQPPRFAAQPRKPEGAEKETDFKPRSSSDTPQVKEEEGTFQAHRSGSLYPERPMYSERPQHQDKVDGPIRIHHTTAVSQFLYGRSVVEAALKNGRRKIYRLYIYSGDARKDVSLSQDVELMKLASYKDVKIIKVPRADLRLLNEMSGGRPHNGCVLEASPLPMPPIKCLGVLSQDVEDLNAPEKPGERWFGVVPTWQSQEEVEINGSMNNIIYQLPRDRKPFVLLLEGILDPGNLGAILRSAAFLGVNGVAISKDLSAGLTAVALKASAGASESLTLFSVRNTTDFLHRSKEAGWLVYAAVPSTSRSRGNSHMNVDRLESYDPLATRPTILVVGSEGEGLTQKVRRAADMQVSIPSPAGLYSTVDSLNVSVATGILCAAFMKKQHGGFEIEESVPTENEEDSLW